MASSEDEYYRAARRYMVEQQLMDRDIRDPRLLSAMNRIPRHLFVPPEHRSLAYSDGPLPIGDGQTISQPYMVAIMTQMLGLLGDETVLEIGTGSGYQAAVLSLLAREVHTVERYPDLASRAAQVLERLGFNNVFVHVADGSLGWPAHAPYQAILVTAAAPIVPQVLLEQLDDEGRLVIPVGGINGQYLECWDRHGSNYTNEAIMPVAFVPLRGQFGWRPDRWED